MTSWTRDEIIAEAAKNQIVNKAQPVQLSAGCFHLKSMLDAPAQQSLVEAIREMLAANPSKMRFQQAEKLAQEGHSDSVVLGSRNDEIISEKKKEQSERYARKHGCYTLDIAGKDAFDAAKMLGLTVEESVNEAVTAAKDAKNDYGTSSQRN